MVNERDMVGALNGAHPEICPEIDFKKIQDIVYWSKKWEVSPNQLIKAYTATQSRQVRRIEEYLREEGFAV